jgi:hypothetical protein
MHEATQHRANALLSVVGAVWRRTISLPIRPQQGDHRRPDRRRRSVRGANTADSSPAHLFHRDIPADGGPLHLQQRKRRAEVRQNCSDDSFNVALFHVLAVTLAATARGDRSFTVTRVDATDL